jgi:hypothetical protein
MGSSVFLDFNLPNAATWFYFSLILTLAVFFQFTRLFSLRNLDLLTLFLLAPGFLFLQEAHALLAAGSPTAPEGSEPARLHARGQSELVVAYGWLVVGSMFWFARAIADLALVRRPTLSPNLNAPGLACLGLALFVCLCAVAVRRSYDPSEQALVGKRPIPITQFREGATAVVKQTQNGNPLAADAQVLVERGLAISCHAAVVIGLLFIGARHFGDRTTGMAMAGLYLLLPYSAYHIGQFHHVWPAAFVTWAVFFYRRPAVSGGLIGLAAGSSFFPVLLFPLWAGFYSRRGTGRFAVSFLGAAAVSVGVVALVLWVDGRAAKSIADALTLSDWQPWKVPQTESLWTGTHWAYRLPVFVLYVAFLVGVTVWPNPKNLSHLVALSAAVLLGVQFWYADRGGVYVLWYLPLLMVMVFRPNLTGHEPPAIEPDGGMLRWAGAAWRKVRGKASPASSNELAV